MRKTLACGWHGKNKSTIKQRKLTRFANILEGTLCPSRIGQLDERYTWLWLGRILATQQRFGYLVNLKEHKRRATKYILNLPFSTTVDYKRWLRSLNLLPVIYWHEYLDLILFYKIAHGLVTINPDILPTVLLNQLITRSTSSKTPKYVIPKCRTTTYQKSFLVKACTLWNEIADEQNITIWTLHLLYWKFICSSITSHRWRLIMILKTLEHLKVYV